MSMQNSKSQNTQYRSNHYVPVWYQKQFVPFEQQDGELFYMDLRPDIYVDSRGVRHILDRVRRRGFKHCFVEKDLYTARLGAMESTDIEQFFFGAIDSKGKRAIKYWANFEYPWDGERDAFFDLLMYMSTQKLRTPKGLGWLAEQIKSKNKDETLRFMLQLRSFYCAIWTECVWQIADASRSQTKFIVSDHPVTVYNRRCGPHSTWCRGFSDPDIRLHASHTIFPLAMEKVLILTNLSWVRNPYQSEISMRPNPSMFRSAMFKFTDIQTLRYLEEPEVHEINFIIKSRAHRYIGAANKEWLYPEYHVTKSDWHKYGNGYLFMPDPRSVTYSTEIIIGHNDGSATGFDEYGRRPWQKDYSGRTKGVRSDWETFHRFQGEFARLYGPYRRGRSYNFERLDKERDSDDYHQYHLSLEARHRRGVRR